MTQTNDPERGMWNRLPRALRGAGRSLPILVLAAVTVIGCKTATTRPYYPPVTGAPSTEIELNVREATHALADVLKGDTIPLLKVVPRDGVIESAWFDVATKQPTHARRIGPDIVRIRAWVNPSRPNHSQIVLETVFRPLADPSLPDRDLDRQVPPDHVIGKRMSEIISELAKLYSSEAPEPAAQ